ncbi:hypothetical protein AB0H34_38365 [Saccharopolyspora shandongensis]|uniref:hypothetical protein n=1 Tax=Saccharopolyspora shandongensis TaxID=418495 RepID=UPI0034048F70
MGLVKDTQRSLYAAVGSVAWVVDTLREVPDQMEHAWQERDQWLHRAGDAYDELAGRGQAIMGSAQQSLRHQARKAGQAARRIPGIAPAEGEITGLVADEEQLPIAGYDSLTAAEIVQQLPALSQRELHQIEGYETRNRARATILGRIDELRGEEPWRGYDEMTVNEILPRMRSLPPDEQAGLATYERRHKQRRTIIESTGRG